MINFSIIIPHYNTPDMLVRGLKSIPKREDVQVIVVDDCSPDIHSFRQENTELNRLDVEWYSTSKQGSGGRARNVGIPHAKGRWVIFADADDFFADGLDELLDDSLDNEEDVVYFRAKSVMSDDISIPSERSPWCNQQIDFYLKHHNEVPIRRKHYSPWAMMIRRDFIEKYHLRFDEVRYCDDYYFTSQCGCLARTIAIVDRVMYVVTEHEGSLTDNYMQKPGELEDFSDVALRVNDFLRLQGQPMDRNELIHYIKLNLKKGNLQYMKEVHDRLHIGYPWIVKECIVKCMLRILFKH